MHPQVTASWVVGLAFAVGAADVIRRAMQYGQLPALLTVALVVAVPCTVRALSPWLYVASAVHTYSIRSVKSPSDPVPLQTDRAQHLVCVVSLSPYLGTALKHCAGLGWCAKRGRLPPCLRQSRAVIRPGCDCTYRKWWPAPDTGRCSP